MGVFFNPSADGFERILRSHWRDQSELITLVAARLETPSRFLCLTRPRRFGKSSACQMLSAFFSRGADARALFRDRAVARAGGAWDARLNQCDVLALDMTGLACRLQAADPLARFERSVLRELQQAFPAALPAVTLADGLHRVHEATGRTFLLLVDEWDIVFRETPAEAPVRRQYEAWLRSLLEGPAAQALSGAYMTGILPMRLSGVDLPSVRESSVTRPAEFEAFLGFTSAEAAAVCRDRGLDAALMKAECGRRSVSETEVWSPVDVMTSFFRGKVLARWASTESGVAGKEWLATRPGLRDVVAALVEGETMPFLEAERLDGLTSPVTVDEVLTLWVHLGWLEPAGGGRAARIPNEDVRRAFRRMLAEGRRPSDSSA